jgi:hypothetical protein
VNPTRLDTTERHKILRRGNPSGDLRVSGPGCPARRAPRRLKVRLQVCGSTRTRQRVERATTGLWRAFLGIVAQVPGSEATQPPHDSLPPGFLPSTEVGRLGGGLSQALTDLPGEARQGLHDEPALGLELVAKPVEDDSAG